MIVVLSLAVLLAIGLAPVAVDLADEWRERRAWICDMERAWRPEPRVVRPGRVRPVLLRLRRRVDRQIEVVAHGTYLELSIDGYVVLSLVDDSFICGAVGFYVESATLGLCGVTLETLSRPVSEHAAEMVYTATQAPDLLAAAGAAGE